ncbi:helix-hairpin-helix domain-containing protein [Mycoplasma struthionis]|uniref:helix-hairpin-helix domain-containing protein n=1 Tax=Mycoplasma struthionis TaxID=538220 RepID=UPI0038CC0E63
MDIVTLGEKNIEILQKYNLINSIQDIYKLKNNLSEMIKINRFGTKSSFKMLEAIENSRQKNLSNLIYALSIKLIGVKVAKFIASKVKKLENLLTFDYDSLLEYNEIGEKIVYSLKTWVQNQKNIDLVNDLIELNLNLEYQDENIINKLDHQSFVITGTLSKSRKYFEDLIIKNGGLISSAISSKTSFLLKGEDAGSKLNKALKLNVKVIVEEELMKMIS